MVNLVFCKIISSIGSYFPGQIIKILTKFLIIDFYEFFMNSSRVSNFIYRGTASLQTKFQKVFSILLGFLRYYKNCLIFTFSPKCQLVAFHAATTNRSDIFTGDRAHQVLPPAILQNFGPLEKCGTFD